MDRLLPHCQELIRKPSTERLRLKLMQAGYDEESVMSMDRSELLEAMAAAVLSAERLRRCTSLADDDTRSIASEDGSEAP